MHFYLFEHYCSIIVFCWPVLLNWREGRKNISVKILITNLRAKGVQEVEKKE